VGRPGGGIYETKILRPANLRVEGPLGKKTEPTRKGRNPKKNQIAKEEDVSLN